MQRALRFARVTTRAVGTQTYFGSANPPNKELRADLSCACTTMGWDGTCSFIDVAVVEPASPAMMGGARSSAEHAGVAAALRAQKKHTKYREVCSRIESTFRDGVIERYGHCGDGLVGLVRLIAGVGHREPWETDYSPTATSQVTHVAQW